MKEKTLEEIVREASDTIWNSSTSLTHNQLDEIISTAIKQSNIALLERIEKILPKKIAGTERTFMQDRQFTLEELEHVVKDMLLDSGFNDALEKMRLKLDEIRKSL